MQDRKKGNYRYTEDGVLLVRKQGACVWGAFGSVTQPGREMWYLCSGEDPDRYFQHMALLGWFGWHRFKEGAWVSGIFYLLTCGCFGVFYLSDLLSMLSGDYFYRETTYGQGEDGIERRMRKIYYRPPMDRGRGMLFLMAAAVVLAVAVFCLYIPLLGWLSSLLSEFVRAAG